MNPTKQTHKKDSKSNILAHTQAKLDLYIKYLEKYLRILGYADFCKQINIFDLFCGEGLYQDGKKGSALLTIECINDVKAELLQSNKIKPIKLLLNDHKEKKIENLKSIIDVDYQENDFIEIFNEDFDEILRIVTSKLSKFPFDNRNLIFIDPFGYKKINKENLENLLINEATEIILFLPIHQMYRFAEHTLKEFEKANIESLYNFIKSFFCNPNDIKTENPFVFIQSIKEALSMNNKYFSCSYYITRKKGNYYALFFICKNIYGLEKMIETKWNLDPGKGKGFDKSSNDQLPFIIEDIEEENYLYQLKHLQEIIFKAILDNTYHNNVNLYELVLKNEFLPKHANIALKNLIKSQKITLINKTKDFGINYNNYKYNTIVSEFKIL